MGTNELIGKVAASYIRDHLGSEESGVARYLLDSLTADQIAAVARAILEDSALYNKIDIKLPINFVGNHGLPEEVLTHERTTYFRNAATDKSALLLSNTGDDEDQSLKELVPIGQPQLQAHPEIWVASASEGLPIIEMHRKWWIKAIQALLEVRSLSLDRLGDYLIRTRHAIENGHPILFALGVAFPAIRAPRDTTFFHNLGDKTATYLSKWKTLYAQAIKKRSCYLVKQTPNQTLLVQEELSDSFDNVKDAIPEEFHPLIEKFIAADSGWNEAAAALAEVEWEYVKPLFDRLKREKFNIGKATQEFYDERDSGLLTENELDYLQRLSQINATEAQEEDEEFYHHHRQELKEESSLKAKWDRFIFGTPIDTEDFVAGIAMCMQWLFDQDFPSSKRKLRISSDRRTKKDLKEVNVDAGLYFISRYKGLKEIFGPRVSWDVGQLMEFDELSEQWKKASKPYVNRSIAKNALRLKFTIELDVELSSGTSDTFSKQLNWIYDPNSIASEFYGDWNRIALHPLQSCHVSREPVSGKGKFESLDLRNVKTLYPAFGQDRGSFVPMYKKEDDISSVWSANLTKSLEAGFISNSTAIELTKMFSAFKEKYTIAILSFKSEGVSSPSLLDQAKAYGELLIAICQKAKGDRNRQNILQPLLRIGIVSVLGGPLTTIVAPWQPLRLAAMAIKASRVGSLIRHLLSADEIFFGDAPLFFKELEKELSHPYYPETILGWLESKPELLSLTDYYLDYSLHESPIVSNGGNDETNENPLETSSLIVGLSKRYLALYPHENSNFSIVLYNCDSARLPYALVDKMSELHSDEEDMRCQIILRHRDKSKLRDLYEKIIESSLSDADSFVSSEVARDFMARLRIGIMADQAPIRNAKDGPSTDIVFLQDVIARHATVEWYLETATPVEPLTFIPAHWARRRPSAKDDMKSVVYLCCPVQTEAGWSFITAITTFIKGDWDEKENLRLLPARQLDFNDPDTSSIFREIHNLGNWVVNYDELLDRRQLINQNVKVIRHKQDATQGRNILISSTAPLNLLRSIVLARVRDLNLDLTDEDMRALTEKFINDANEISGDIVLRAAKRGRNARELMGIVLSRFLIRHELDKNSRFGWYFLDDYAEWLGQREEQMADILVLSPQYGNRGEFLLAVVICESKYIDAENLVPKRKESQKQLRDTVRRIDHAIFGEPKRLDRDLWLSRFSDLLVSGIQFSSNDAINLSDWRRSIRKGECGIFLRGYSHVFVSGPSDASECSDFVAVPETSGSYQEVYSRSRLRELVSHYWHDSDPLAIRIALAEKNIWGPRTYVSPSERSQIVQLPINETKVVEEPISSSTNFENVKSQEKRIVAETKEEKSEEKQKFPAQSCFSYTNIQKLLSAHSNITNESVDDLDWLRRIQSLCKAALQQFQLQSKLLSSTLTPNAALLRFQGSAQLTVEQVLKRRSEFLTTHSLNIISVRAEPGTVMIAIARPNRTVLYLPDVWKSWSPMCENGNQSLLIAVKEEDNKPLFMSPRINAPHTLIAGSTGSGKSVLMQNIILGIACTNTPKEASIILIDPKLGVDYYAFEELPHIEGGVIDNHEHAIKRLSELVIEMDRRYAILKKNKVTNIFDLNLKTDSTEKLPVLWVIHDEFAEWMMTANYSDAVSDVVSRLGVKARAAGISLVFAAQRPDANVMPMQLRANLGNRLVLRVDSEGTSEIALGEKGAERLLGKGHLAAKLEGEPNIIFAQVPFVDEKFLELIVSSIRASE